MIRKSEKTIGKIFAAALLGVVLVARAEETCDLGAEFAKPEAWAAEVDPVDFVNDHKSWGFAFNSNVKRDLALCKKPDTVTFHGLAVLESRVRFGASGGVRRVELYLFNKGDWKQETAFTRENQEALVASVREKLTALADEKPRAPEKQAVRQGQRVEVQRWTKSGPAAIELAWAYSRGKNGGAMQPEFVRVVLTSSAAGASGGGSVGAKAKGGATKAGLTANLFTSPNGDAYVANVPMVDQGAKGYCAVAAAERVLRYYGVEVDEHEIAQQAGTTVGGTRTADMAEAVKSIGGKNNLAYQKIVDFEKRRKGETPTWQSSLYFTLLERYNKAAKKTKKPAIDWHDFEKDHMIDVEGILLQMDPKTLKLAQMQLRGDFSAFIKKVQMQTAEGVPLFWSVMLGYYPEPDCPQAKGGHMRLIIGYNKKQHEILYTDSWGPGHELKRMPEEWAWAITHHVFCLRPRK